jgi:hypothetical protein
LQPVCNAHALRLRLRAAARVRRAHGAGSRLPDLSAAGFDETLMIKEGGSP